MKYHFKISHIILKSKSFIRLLNNPISIDFSQFIQNIFLSIFIFIPVLLEFYISGGKSRLVIFLIYTLLFSVLSHLIGKWFLFISIPFLLLSALIIPYMIITKTSLSYNVIASIYETDYHESLELISSPFFIKYILIFSLVLFLPFTINHFGLISKRSGGIKIKPIVLILPLLLLIGFTSARESKRITSDSSGLFPYFPLRQIVLMKKSLIDSVFIINQYKNMKIDFKILQDKTNDVSVILVVGEAARKSSLNIYGNRYNTTPYMTNLSINYPQKITFFPNMVSIAPFTRVAIPSLLSMANALNYNKISSTPSFFKIINQTNMETIFISRRNQNSFHDSLPNEIIKDNKIIIDINGKYDGDLLDSIYKQVNKSEKKLITLHLLGSHYSYKDRYPSEYNCFMPDIPEANYLSSIRYTDFVLSKIMNYIDKIQKPYVLIYTSDHGEYVNDNGDNIYGHGFKNLTKNEVEIPLIFVFNDEFIKRKKNLINLLDEHKDAKISLDNISHTVLGLLGISDLTYYDEKYNIASQKFIEHSIYLIDRDMDLANINTIEFDNHLKNTKIELQDICKNKFKL